MYAYMPYGKKIFNVREYFIYMVKNILLKDSSRFTCSCSWSHAHKLMLLSLVYKGVYLFNRTCTLIGHHGTTTSIHVAMHRIEIS